MTVQVTLETEAEVSNVFVNCYLYEMQQTILNVCALLSTLEVLNLVDRDPLSFKKVLLDFNKVKYLCQFKLCDRLQYYRARSPPQSMPSENYINTDNDDDEPIILNKSTETINNTSDDNNKNNNPTTTMINNFHELHHYNIVDNKKLENDFDEIRRNNNDTGNVNNMLSFNKNNFDYNSADVDNPIDDV